MKKQLICVKRTRDYSNNVILYDLMDQNGEVELMGPKAVKSGISGGVFEVCNLSLAKNGKLLYCNNYDNPNYCYIDSFDLYTRYKRLTKPEKKRLIFKSCENGKRLLGKYKLMNVSVKATEYKDFIVIETNDTVEFISEKPIRFRDSNLRENAGLKAEGHFRKMRYLSIDLSQVDTSEMTNMGYMFEGCFVNQLNLANFNTNNVVSMEYMFCACGSTNMVLDLRSFNTSNVKNMACMFSWCKAHTDLDLSHFDTKNVETMYGMFALCSFQSINIKGFKFGNTTDIRDMWRDYKGIVLK